MNESIPDYDPRYLAGILFFNDRDFFEAPGAMLAAFERAWFASRRS